MSICNVAIIGENVALEAILPRLAKEGGFDSISFLEFKALEEVLELDNFGLHLIAPDMPFFQNTHKHNNEDFKKYIHTYLENKAKFAYTNPTEEEIKLFKCEKLKINILIVKCHF